jgi:chromosome segregation ATPase
MITIDKMAAVQGLIDSIFETVQDRTRLLKEAQDRELIIDKLNDENTALRERVRDLEARNARITDDIIQFEAQLADANQQLDEVRAAIGPRRENVVAINGGQRLIEDHRS